MTDVFSKAKRSAVMAAVKSRDTLSTEIALRKLLRKHSIFGWQSHPKSILGKPDFIFCKKKIAVFVDGCFWHGCGTCTRNRRPATNTAFWRKKIERNMLRDKCVTRNLRRSGWTVLRVWEHAIEKTPDKVVRKLSAAVGLACENE